MTNNGSMRHRVRLAPTMGRSLATLLSIGVTIVHTETVTALEISASVGAAGVGGGLSAGHGSDGLSTGVSVGSEGSRAATSSNAGSSGIGGAIGANAGAVGVSAQGNVGPSGFSAGAGVSSGANAGSVGAPVSAGIGGQQGSSSGVGTGLGGKGTSASESGLAGAGSLGAPASASPNGGNPSQGVTGPGRIAGTVASIAPTALATSSGVMLPPSLWPYESQASDGGWFRSIYVLKPLRARPGTPQVVVQSCRNALASGASSHGAIQVDVASAGRTARLKDGSLSAPVEARIVFQRGNRVQVRQARLTCRLDERGRTLAML